MNKQINKIFSLLILCACLIVFLTSATVSAEASYYKIPKHADFIPNKAADDIETIVNQKSVISSNAIDNEISIDGMAVALKHSEALSEMNGYITKLNSEGMYLNRDLVNVVTVQINNINFSEFVEILIDENNLNQIANINSLKIVFEDSNEYIVLSKECIGNIITNYREFKFQMKKLSDAYTVRFLDKNNNIIDKYKADIKISLPAKHSEQTVYLFTNNTQENWGGQYNAITRAMEFMTKYSGEYNVASPEIVIDDIDNLTEYEKQAIRFMVVRGYFELDNKKFQPSSYLTRYDFAESLVRMFFALNNEAQCSFPDVNKKYYRYVAASQKDSIVQGFADGTFRGEENVTVEQVIALTARTINQKNGYVYPENIDKYLNFTDDNIIGEWAKKEIALAIREGIYSNDMKLKFADDISRKDAAVMLYRLFMIMNNTPEPAEIIEYNVGEQINHETVWNKTNAIIVCAAVVAINIVALVLSILFIKKKEKDDEVDKG